MKYLAVLFIGAFVASAVVAFPERRRSHFGRSVSNPDHDVEEVAPVNTGTGSSSDSDERPGSFSPFGPFGISGFGSIRPVSRGRDSPYDDDDDAPSGFFPSFVNPYFVSPMNSFMVRMAEMMAAMRRQMDQVLNRLPPEGDWSKLGNTTSETKVIDGHVVTVNETTIDGENGNVYRVRVLSVRPSDEPGTAESEEGTKDEVPKQPEEETETERAENEIPKVGSEVDDLNA